MDKQKNVKEGLTEAAENYWDYVPAMLSSALRSHSDINEYIKRYRGLIDFGIAPNQLALINGELPKLPNKQISLKMLFVSDWIVHYIQKVTKRDERNRILEKEKRLSKDSKLIDLDIEKKQLKRRELLDNTFDFSEYRGRIYKQLIQSLEMVDKIKYDSMLKNDASSRGRYFAVDERRTFASERQWVAQQERKIEALLGMIEERETRIIISDIFQGINQLLEEKLKIHQELEQCEEKRFQLEEEIAAIPIDHITSKISEKVLRLKTIISSEIERVGGETGKFRKANEKVIDIEEVAKEIRRIAEFDRDIFGNNFVNRFGRPSVLFVPGMGDGFYTHEDNLLIIPMIPNFNIADSLASAFVSYRIYHDDGKQMLRSYGHLAMNVNVGNNYTLKNQLAKSYGKWITMEYEGYRTLDKEERVWFLQRFAPKKDECFYPFELTKGGIHGDEFDELVLRINRTMKGGTITNQDLWYASIIFCKKGNYEKVEELTKKLIKKSNDYIFAYFNLGMVAKLRGNNKLAIDAFTKFIEKSGIFKWWARVAQDNILEMKAVKTKK